MIFYKTNVLKSFAVLSILLFTYSVDGAERLSQRQQVEVYEEYTKESTIPNYVLTHQGKGTILVTPHFFIKINEMTNGMYSYTAWGRGANLSRTPMLELKKGKKVLLGVGGDYSFEFKNGRYEYICNINVRRGPNTPYGQLIVYKDEQIIRQENAEGLEQ